MKEEGEVGLGAVGRRPGEKSDATIAQRKSSRDLLDTCI